MRPDMGKVITERPRVHGDGGKSRPRKGYRKQQDKIPLDEQPTRESMRQLTGKTKSFTDVLGPMRGWVKKQIGRPWSKVKSEIDKVLPATGGLSYSHARDHLLEMIDETLVERQGDDGKPVLMRPDGYVPHQCEAYICPTTGIVKQFTKGMRDRSREYERKYGKYGLRGRIFRGVAPTKPEPINQRGPIRWPGKKHQGDVFYATINGIWHEFALLPCVVHHERVRVATPGQDSIYWVQRDRYEAHWDMYLGESCSAGNAFLRQRRYGGNRFAASRKQLNHREIKRLKLNDPVSQLPNVLGGRNDRGKHKRRTRRKS